MRTFASDNTAPAAPDILQAVAEANTGDAVSYGDDPFTERAHERFRDIFGEDTGIYFAFNGTGANVVALSCLLRPWEAVICPASAHLQTDECGAMERFSGCKVLPVVSRDGKLHVDDLCAFSGKAPDEHHVVPRALSLSQSTEYGTLYTPAELRDICEFAHAQGWYVHLDGARIANAAAALNLGLRECTRDLGIDVLTFGGTKNGLLYGEAIVFFGTGLHRGAAPFVRKQGMQLASKMRYIAAQFCALLENDRWRSLASHANAMTQRLAERVRSIDAVRITRPVECNAIFATIDRAAIPRIQKEYFFYVFDDALPEVRWMTHHATTPRDVDAFAEAIARETRARTD
ncbi:MAG TPA: beta-eliminating lyase-related protein [Candidatus Baltobacteraceae bacterium]|jgi:threonine aldolase|nr:beta-eliminating lyase-related protein [Candidatus Baltobacteraceae bacterium]